MKRVLIACGNGVATSTMVAMKVREALKEQNLNVTVEQCKLMEIPSKGNSYDLIITTGKYDNVSEITTPIISGMAFLTGINKAQVIEEIAAKLR